MLIDLRPVGGASMTVNITAVLPSKGSSWSSPVAVGCRCALGGRLAKGRLQANLFFVEGTRPLRLSAEGSLWRADPDVALESFRPGTVASQELERGETVQVEVTGILPGD